MENPFENFWDISAFLALIFFILFLGCVLAYFLSSLPNSSELINLEKKN